MCVQLRLCQESFDVIYSQSGLKRLQSQDKDIHQFLVVKVMETYPKKEEMKN